MSLKLVAVSKNNVQDELFQACVEDTITRDRYTVWFKDEEEFEEVLAELREQVGLLASLEQRVGTEV